MRFFFGLLCFLLGVVVIGHALLVGTDMPFMRGAPQIERQIAGQVAAALRPYAGSTDGLSIGSSGKNVVLGGSVQSADQRDAIMTAARSVPMAGQIVDRLEVLPLASPYRFQAEKAKDGALSLAGHVPDRATKEQLSAAATAAAKGAPVTLVVEIATGVPEGDWAARVEAALAALAHLESGVAKLSDQDQSITGAAPDGASWEAADAALKAPGAGHWRADIAGGVPEEGYLFTAMKAPDGTVLVEGHAPDKTTRDDLFAAAGEIAVSKISGRLTIAAGMPEGWPERVRKALPALGAAISGLLTVTPGKISLAAEVETEPDRAVLAAYVGADWDAEILVLDPTPPSDVTIELAYDGTLRASGLLPGGAVSPADLVAALPGIQLAGLDLTARGLPADWTGVIGGLAIVLPNFQIAEARIAGKSLQLRGNLKRGFGATGAEAALKNELGEGWALELAINESAPLAEVVLAQRDGNIAVSGVLPFGLDPGVALDIFGDTAGGEGLTGGGDGDPAIWRANLRAVSQALKLFNAVTGRIGAEGVEINGQLAPGYSEAAVRTLLDAGLAEGWTTTLTVEETPPGEGDTRVSLATGETETYRSGFWLPVLDFPVSRTRCEEEVGATLERGQIVFLSGSTAVDESDTIVLNRLAAVAVRCLNSSSMSLEIGGHTDSVGNDSTNKIISEARAQAVMAALRERGVRADAMRATGYGETQPIATNDTDEGRAKNRRITFDWKERGG